VSPRTPDRTPGPAVEEELQLEDRTVDGNPIVDGAVRFVGGDIVAKLTSGVVSLTAGGSDVNILLVDDVTGSTLSDDVLGNLLVNQ